MTTLSKLYKREAELTTLGRILTRELKVMVDSGVSDPRHHNYKDYLKTKKEFLEGYKEFKAVTAEIESLVDMNDPLNKSHSEVDNKIAEVVAQL